MVKVFKPISIQSPGETTLIKQEKEYQQTLSEFAANKYSQVIKSGSATGGVTVLYTVPKNFFVFITGAWVSGYTAGASAEELPIFIRTASAANFPGRGVIVSALTAPVVNSRADQSLSFPMPIKIFPGESIVLNSGGAQVVSGGFSGFEVPFLP